MPFPSPGNLPDPGIKSGSSALQADALPSEPTGKPKIEGKGVRKSDGKRQKAKATEESEVQKWELEEQERD